MTRYTALCGLLTLMSTAPVMADPMRPFVLSASSVSASSSSASAVQAAADHIGARAKTIAGQALPALRAIRVDADGRRLALFDEQWLTVGAKLGAQGTLAAIDTSQVQVQRGKTFATLHLLPPLLAPLPEPAAPDTSRAARIRRNAPPSLALAPTSLPRAPTPTTP